MLYYLFEFLESKYALPGASVFQYLSFRSAASALSSLLLAYFLGKRIIKYLRIKQIGENVRDLGLKGEESKKGTPTMGGIVILICTLIPVLLFGKINVYSSLLIFTTIWLGLIGFIDDYIKIFKKQKSGLAGKFKIFGQIILGVIVGGVLYFQPVKQNTSQSDKSNFHYSTSSDSTKLKTENVITTTLPFYKNNEFNYSTIVEWIHPNMKKYTWILFVFIVILIVTAVSNGANLTDGLDGLAAGNASIIIFTLGVFAWISGNVIYSDYLNIAYIPNVGEITIFIAALLGALIGFLWFNAYPAQIFMGDVGSLSVGGIIAVIAIIIRKELLLPLLCGVFFIESLSVIIQVLYFKYTKRKTGAGKRVFLMAPLHHHFQKKGYHESKIVSRFWVVGILLALLTIVTLKIR